MKAIGKEMQHAVSTKLDQHLSDYGDMAKSLASEAVCRYGDEIKQAMYSAEVQQIENLQRLMNEAEGAVLLSTTTPVLRRTLITLLERYGGSVASIEVMIPLED